MKTEVEFPQIKVTLILETPEEAAAFYNIVNFSPILDATNLSFGKVRKQLQVFRNEKSFADFCQYMKEHS